MSLDELIVGTTFSGIGAPEQALKNLGIPHRVVWACDVDRYAKKTYFQNHSCDKWYDDITKIDPKELEYVDLYCFGFPCTDCSEIGTRDLSKGRTALVSYSLDIIDQVKPKYFLYENVKGLLGSRFKSFFFGIMSRLSENYNTDTAIFNSKYWGVPQSRERVFCLGTIKDLPQVKLPKENKENIGHLSSILEKEVDSKYFISPQTMSNMIEFKERQKDIGNTFGFRVITDMAYTLPTDPGYGDVQIIKDGENYRRLTPREWARLQGFPDSFQLYPGNKKAYKQLGNSITVPVLEAIFRELTKENQDGKLLHGHDQEKPALQEHKTYRYTRSFRTKFSPQSAGNPE